MEYMLLIYTPSEVPEASAEERQGMFAAFGKYTDRLREAGALLAGDPLQGPHTAATVRSREGETLTTDGPFAETREYLGGYYKIDVESADEAIGWAKQIPSIPHGGSVEVRPVMAVPADHPTSV